jgi:hypothetical protein
VALCQLAVDVFDALSGGFFRLDTRALSVQTVGDRSQRDAASCSSLGSAVMY